MKVILSPTATKHLKKLPKVVYSRVFRKLHLLEADPFAGKSLERDLKGHYSLKAWPYRIIYIIYKEKKVILIMAIEHRQGVYK